MMSMDMRPREDDSCSTSHGMSRVSWKPNTSHRLHNIMNETNSAHSHQSHFYIQIHITSFQRFHLPNSFLPSKFQTKTQYALLFLPFRATSPADFISFYLPNRICDEQHES